MKIIFVNSPVIRSKYSSPENNFKVDGFVFKPIYRKIPGSGRILNILNKIFGFGKSIRYGVRAGSRWPWTMNKPHGGPPYPFFMGYAAAYLRANGFEVNIIDAVAEEQYNYQVSQYSNNNLSCKAGFPGLISFYSSVSNFYFKYFVLDIH